MSATSSRAFPFRPSAASWATVAAALLCNLLELAGQGAQLALFALRRERWRREMAERVARDPLPAAAAGVPLSPAHGPGKEIPR